jgi:hypothetical protein
MDPMEKLMLQKYVHQLRPRNETYTPHVDRIQDLFITEAVSGQQSERNLVNAINDFAPFNIKLGTTKHKIVSSKQLGGGNPEPKADISITTSTGKEIGISMKKPNFDFFENWMNENKLRLLLKGVGVEGDPQDLLVKELKDEAETLSKTPAFKNSVKKEYDALLELIPSGELAKLKSLTKDGSKFKVKTLSIPISDRIMVGNALIADPKKRFGKKLKRDGDGAPVTTFKVLNIYKSLKEVLGKNYTNFLKNVIGGTTENKHPAEYVLVETINKGIDVKQTISALEKSMSIDDTVKKYEDDDKVNIKFRLRPTTIARACYGKTGTNQSKYKKGDQFYSNDSVGVSWTVFVSR